MPSRIDGPATALGIASRSCSGNGAEHFLHKLALNSVGVSCVPINPDLRPAEIAYLIEHSEPEFVLTLGARAGQAAEAIAAAGYKPPVVVAEDDAPPPKSRRCFSRTRGWRRQR